MTIPPYPVASSTKIAGSAVFAKPLHARQGEADKT